MYQNFFSLPSSTVSGEGYACIWLSVSPQGSAFKLSVNESKTFTAEALNGTAPFNFTWVVNPSGNFSIEVNGLRQDVSNASSLAVLGPELTLFYPYASEEYVTIQAVVTDDSGLSGFSEKIVVADPYTSPGFKFDGSVADSAIVCRPDGKGWFRAYNGTTGAKITSLDSTSADVCLNGALALAVGKKVYVDGGAWAGAQLVVPASTTLVADPSTTGIKYTSIANGAKIDEPNFNSVFGGYSGGEYTIVANQSSAATVATWYVAFKPDNSVWYTSTNVTSLTNNLCSKLPSGGLLHYSSGTFSVNSKIVVNTAKITFEGEGKQTVFYLADNTNSAIFEVKGSEVQFVVFRDFMLDGNKAHNTGGGGIIMRQNTVSDDMCTVENVYIQNTAGDGIDTFGRGNIFHNVQIYHSGYAGIYCPATDSFFSNCVVGYAKEGGFQITGGNNMVANCKAFYCGLNAATSTPYGFYIGSYTQVINCQAQDNYYEGFFIYNKAYTSLSGCLAQNNGRHAAGTYDGIVIDGASCHDNQVKDCVSTGSYQRYGVRISQNAYNVSVQGNVLNGNSVGAIINAGLNAVISGNVGFSTVNSGSNTGTGAQQTIAHGLSGTPAVVLLSNGNGTANAYQSASADATNIYITADSGISYCWYVEYTP